MWVAGGSGNKGGSLKRADTNRSPTGSRAGTSDFGRYIPLRRERPLMSAICRLSAGRSPGGIVDPFLPRWLARDIVEEMGWMKQVLGRETLAGKASYPG